MAIIDLQVSIKTDCETKREAWNQIKKLLKPNRLMQSTASEDGCSFVHEVDFFLEVPENVAMSCVGKHYEDVEDILKQYVPQQLLTKPECYDWDYEVEIEGACQHA